MEEKSSHYIVLFIGPFLCLLHSGGVSSSCDNINEIDFAEFTYEPEGLAPHPDGTVASIECGILYQIVPTAFERTTCTNGSWTGPLPRCRHVPRNCQRHQGLVQIYGRDCQTKCRNRLEGACPGDRRCLCDGVCGWSCIPIYYFCPEVADQAGISVTYDPPERRFNGYANFSCGEGYIYHSGSRRLRCMSNRQWGGGNEIVCIPNNARNRTVPSCNPHLVFLEELQNLEVAEGDLLEPRCRVSDQDATLKWFKDGQRLDSGAVDGIFINHLNQLIIPSFKARHSGNYSCVVYYGDMECIRSDAIITFDPRSYFEFVPVNAFVNIHDDHQFLCVPIENTWSVVWEKDGQPLEQGNLLIVGGNLYLTDIRDENVGKYTCVAHDQFRQTKGRVHAWLYLTDPPQIDITTESTEPPHGSCSNSCCTSSEYSCNPEGCYCDSDCVRNDNCCDDYEDVCPSLDSTRDVLIWNTTYNMRGGELLRVFTPNYPNNYNNLENILWHVRGVHGRQFLITFVKVRMHSTYDYVRIHTGISDVFEESTQIFHLTYNPSGDLPDHYWSVHPYIWLQFSTDAVGTDQGLFVMINAVSVGDCDGIWFQCTNGQCIYSSAACNGLSDCVDSSDEYQCESTEPPHEHGSCSNSSPDTNNRPSKVP